MRDDTIYSNAVGRVRVLERNLLDKLLIEKMLAAPSVEDAVRVLAEIGYKTKEDIQGYEELLEKELELTYFELKRISPEPKIIELFMLKADYHNLKVALKSEFSETSNKHLYLEWGTIPVIRLETALSDRSFKDLPKIMADCISEVLDVYGRTSDTQATDIIIDSACFSNMKALAGEIDSTFLNELLEIEADFTNIKLLLRTKMMEKPLDFLMRAIISGGRINKTLISEMFEKTLDEILKNIFRLKYDDSIEKGVESFIETGTLTELEKLMDDYIIRYLKKYKYVAMGIQPLIGYLKAREYEIRNARIIIVGKANSIDGDVIRERLRETYA